MFVCFSQGFLCFINKRFKRNNSYPSGCIILLINACAGNVPMVLFQSDFKFMSLRAKTRHLYNVLSELCLTCHLICFIHDAFFIFCCLRCQSVVFMGNWWAANTTRNTSFALKPFTRKFFKRSKIKIRFWEKHLSIERIWKYRRKS